MHRRASQVFPVREDIILAKNNGYLVNIRHKKSAEIENFDESNDYVLLPLFLYWINCGAC